MKDTKGLFSKRLVAPRSRVILDNDFGGDPDGLFQLAHHLLSPSVEIRGIIGSFFPSGTNFGALSSAGAACAAIRELIACLEAPASFPVFPGADAGLSEVRTPVVSEGAEAIVREAMRDDSDLPLYIACGGGLTDIASACLMEPEIVGRLTLVWIGGYGVPTSAGSEYNLGMDIKAAQFVFNDSRIPLWQIPCETYRQALVSHAELLRQVKPRGKTGGFLADKLEDFLYRAKQSGFELGETYVLGDSPLVLVTALPCAFDPDNSSSVFTSRPAPHITDTGAFEENPGGRTIRVYTRLDTRLLFEDFFSKLALSAVSG
ncbi:MAG: nucleoside hydrolase [Spirochaetales bacterium]|nr:nucleoside hydrolase [Spirochaetales bacterium]